MRCAVYGGVSQYTAGSEKCDVLCTAEVPQYTAGSEKVRCAVYGGVSQYTDKSEIA
ncbi:MAG: hypothetical protein SPI19_02810 [Peptoniphilaceae bacterium]|nr:hypothetical protein [Peptoniphilaceae bacterium]